MKKITVTDLCYTNVDFVIADIFPESWGQRKEFSLYRQNARPCSALFFVCTDIEVTFFSPDRAQQVAGKGDIVFIPQGICYHVRVTGGGAPATDTYTVNFDLLDETREKVLLADRIEILANRQDHLPSVHLKNLYDTFYRPQKSETGDRRNLAKAKGEFFLLLDLVAESASRDSDFYYPIRRGAEAFLREWSQNEKIEKYAQMSGVSVTYFYRCFRKWSGSSPIEYRNLLRLSNAESLLRCTDMQIKEIACAVGFEDPFYFCRIFSERFGTSPKNYRKKHHTD
ncbi:MAG: helix-turn-helix transcriptional regulator [Clostridia bacterium]|nr:helix-turn-helix transcriptional regulator [Clostridia bacterium]